MRRRIMYRLTMCILVSSLAAVCLAQTNASETSSVPAGGWHLKDLADLAEALSLIVGAATLLFAFRSERAQKLKEEVTNWQRVVVYRIIAKGKAEFEEIKKSYLGEAQQLAGLELAKKEIQDNALRLVLMSLIESKLISVAEDDRYMVNVVSDLENTYKEFALKEMRRRRAGGDLLAKILSVLGNDSGKYTLETLFRITNASELGFTFEEYNAVAHEFIRLGMIVVEEGRVRIGSTGPGVERTITRTVINSSGSSSRLVRPGGSVSGGFPNENAAASGDTDAAKSN